MHECWVLKHIWVERRRWRRYKSHSKCDKTASGRMNNGWRVKGRPRLLSGGREKEERWRREGEGRQPL